MITYKIDGINSTFQSKEEKFDSDVKRLLYQHSLSEYTEVTILENGISQNDGISKPRLSSTGRRNASKLKTVSEDTGDSERVYLVESINQAVDLQPVHDNVSDTDLSTDDLPLTNLDDNSIESN